MGTIIDDRASYYFKEFNEMTEWVASVNTRGHKLTVASLTDLSWFNLDNLLKIQEDHDNRSVTICTPLPKLEPIQGIPLFDWDDNRKGILVARVRLTVPNYTVDQKTRVLNELITSVKSGIELPKEVTVLTEDFHTACNQLKLKSLNFRRHSDGSVPDDGVIFVMGEHREKSL